MTSHNSRTAFELRSTLGRAPPRNSPDVIEIESDLNEELTDLTAAQPNQIEQEDLEYMGDDGDGDWGSISIPALGL